MDVVNRIAEPFLGRLPCVILAELPVIVDRARNQAEVERLRLLGLAIDIKGEALVRAIGQPVVDRQAVALRLRDLLALLVEKHLVVEALGRSSAEHARDLARLDDRIDEVLARHLVIDPERDPAHRPIDLPLKLAQTRERGLLDPFAILVDEGDDARRGVDDIDRNLQHDAGPGADRQHRRIGRAALLTERRQHHVHDRIEPGKHRA